MPFAWLVTVTHCQDVVSRNSSSEMALVTYLGEAGDGSCDVAKSSVVYLHPMPKADGKCLLSPGKNSLNHDQLEPKDGKSGEYHVKAFCVDKECQTCSVDKDFPEGSCETGLKLVALSDLQRCGVPSGKKSPVHGAIVGWSIAGAVLFLLLVLAVLYVRLRKRGYSRIN